MDCHFLLQENLPDSGIEPRSPALKADSLPTELWGKWPRLKICFRILLSSALEKELATHSSILSWRIPWTVEPGGLQSIRPQRVRYNWATNIFNTLINNPVLRCFILKELLMKVHGTSWKRMLNITKHQGNANQNLNELSPHTFQNGCYQKYHK